LPNGCGHVRKLKMYTQLVQAMQQEIDQFDAYLDPAVVYFV
jgi:hypothetical protein